jgi:hypothetical protein
MTTLMDHLHELSESDQEIAYQIRPERGGLGDSSLESECYKLAELIRSEDRAVDRAPGLTIKCVGKAFERTVQWVRWAETKGLFKRPDGRKIYPHRSNPPHAISGFRLYNFAQMADMAEALYLHKGLDKKDSSHNLERFWQVLRNIRDQQLAQQQIEKDSELDKVSA